MRQIQVDKGEDTRDGGFALVYADEANHVSWIYFRNYQKIRWISTKMLLFMSLAIDDGNRNIAHTLGAR